ncbi:hypothetical protein C4B68_12810 [Streptomyces dengpaensis]|uniref:Uncharacterized protein n=1 Tax=Streptomyces dengpaensis TaxID=2049881 RepID=A0ABN5HZU7_9ACTN|nr:hypothetical protein C4B68_12810 [Streptomyces dengpaensis]PIB10470.1 hypothetical protein B1C81_08300 [Streptomyces sp. HG99]
MCPASKIDDTSRVARGGPWPDARTWAEAAARGIPDSGGSWGRAPLGHRACEEAYAAVPQRAGGRLADEGDGRRAGPGDHRGAVGAGAAPVRRRVTIFNPRLDPDGSIAARLADCLRRGLSVRCRDVRR